MPLYQGLWLRGLDADDPVPGGSGVRGNGKQWEIRGEIVELNGDPGI